MKRTHDASGTSWTPLSLTSSCLSRFNGDHPLPFEILFYWFPWHCILHFSCLPLSLLLPIFLSSLLIFKIVLPKCVCFGSVFGTLLFSEYILSPRCFKCHQNVHDSRNFLPGPNISPRSFHLQILAGYFHLLVSPKLNTSWNKFTTFAILHVKWLFFWLDYFC